MKDKDLTLTKCKCPMCEKIYNKWLNRPPKRMLRIYCDSCAGVVNHIDNTFEITDGGISRTLLHILNE